MRRRRSCAWRGRGSGITRACNVGQGLYKYRYVNVFNGGTLTFADAMIDFWGASILVEKGSRLTADSASNPIGKNGGVLTVHLYGSDDASDIRIGCKTRAAVDNIQNPRKVPGILAAPFDDFSRPQENVPFHSDIDHPSAFWITNGYTNLPTTWP